MIPFIEYSWNDKIIEVENRSVVAKHVEAGIEVGVTIKRNRKDLCTDNIFCTFYHVNILLVVLH